MKNIYQSLLLVIAGATQKELASQIKYLKVENEILRSRLPSRVFVTEKERHRLVKFGCKLTAKVLHQLVSIVHPDTLLLWVCKSRKEKPAEPVRRGRPKTPEQLRQLIRKMARENDWGYTRIMGELKKLGITPPSKNTVKNILKAVGLDPGPQRDGAFSTVFDETLRPKHVQVKKTQFRSPNMNAFAERFVQSIKQECLDHFVVFGAQHMDVLCREYLEYYHTERPHQGRENELLVGKGEPHGECLRSRR